MRIIFFSVILFSFSLAGCNNEKNVAENAKQDTLQPAQPVPAGNIATEKPAQPFSKELSYNSMKFLIASPGTSAANSFTITPSGLAAADDPDNVSIDGLVIDAIIDDIDGDNSPEIAIITKEVKSSMAYIFSVNKGRSMSAVNFPDITDAKLLDGYQGGDEFNFVEGSFIRRFPLYKGGIKLGKVRQLQFKLKAGEAMKQLMFDRSAEF